MTTPAPLPKTLAREIGHATNALGVGWWQDLSDEETPELLWPLNLAVYDRMRRQDAQVTSVLRAVKLPVLRTTWRVDPAGARDEVTALVAEDLGLPVQGDDSDLPPMRGRDRFSWQEHLRTALLQLDYGHMPFEQVYRFDDAGRVRLRKLAPRMPKTLTGIDVAPDGGLLSIRQRSTGPTFREVVIPVERLVMYAHDREPGAWRGQSLLRPAYKNWLLKDRLLRVWTQSIARNGMGVPVYTGPENPLDPNVDLDRGLTLARSVRSGDDAGAALPFGAELTLKGVEGELPDAATAVRYHDEQIARAVLAHFLNLGTQTGSWALGSTFADFFTLSLQALGEQIADVATQHVVEDLVELNFGPDEPAPRLVFDEIGSRNAATADALQALVDAGLIFPDRDLEQHLRGRFGLPLKGGSSTPAPPPPPAEDAEARAARAQATLEARQHELALEQIRVDGLRDVAREQAAAQRAVAEATVRAAAARVPDTVVVQPAAPAAVQVDVQPTLVKNLIDVQPAPVHIQPAPPRAVTRRVEYDDNGDVARIIEE